MTRVSNVCAEACPAPALCWCWSPREPSPQLGDRASRVAGASMTAVSLEAGWDLVRPLTSSWCWLWHTVLPNNLLLWCLSYRAATCSFWDVPQVPRASLREINSPNSCCRLITWSWMRMICFSSLLEAILPKVRSRQGDFPLAGLAVWTQFHSAIISGSEQGWVYNCAGVISSRRRRFLSEELSRSARLLRVWDAAIPESGGVFVLRAGMPTRRRPGGFLLMEG